LHKNLLKKSFKQTNLSRNTKILLRVIICYMIFMDLMGFVDCVEFVVCLNEWILRIYGFKRSYGALAE
jgi:hypothetical protein